MINWYNKWSKDWKINTDVYWIEELWYYIKYPALVLLKEYFGSSFFSDISRWNHLLNLEETSPSKILGISKGVAREIKRMGLRIYHVEDIKDFIRKQGVDQFYNVIKGFEGEFGDRLGEYFGTRELGNLLTKISYLLDNGYTLKGLFQYINNVRVNQAIVSMNDILQLLYDYVRMSIDMEVGFIKYPKSLKLVHDVRSRDYQVILSKHEVELFKKRYENRKDLLYRNKEMGYEIVLPDEPIDVVREGQELRHCVASYVKKVVRQESLIVFMRKIEELEKPYVTIELNGEGTRILQARGKFDRKLNVKEQEFLKKWGEEKGMIYSI